MLNSKLNEQSTHTHTHTRKVLRRCEKEQKGTKTTNTQEEIRAERTHLRNMAKRNLSDETGRRNEHNAHKTRDYQNTIRNITSSEKRPRLDTHAHKCDGNESENTSHEWKRTKDSTETTNREHTTSETDHRESKGET